MLVKGLFAYDGVAFVGGQSGAAKTLVAVYLAHSLATTLPFFGRMVRGRVGVEAHR
jgi:RecA-family ATPase